MQYISRIVEPTRILSLNFETSTLVLCVRRNAGKQGSVTCCYQGQIYSCGIPGTIKIWWPLSLAVNLGHESSFFVLIFNNKEKTWSYPCNRPWRPIGLWEVEAPTFSRSVFLNRWAGARYRTLVCRKKNLTGRGLTKIENHCPRQSAHRWRWGCKPHAPSALYPQGDTWYSFLLKAESTPGP
jgi:hypothetical protein